MSRAAVTMHSDVAPLRLGSRVRFRDRWEGRLAALEVDEEWEVLNVVIKRGLLRSSSVKMPLVAASDWSAEHIAFDGVTSRQAFAREVPPVAAPARPLSGETPLAVPGGRLSGALVDAATRKVSDLLLRRGFSGREARVSVGQVSFEGKAMRLAVQLESLPLYHSDEQLRLLVREALANAHRLTPDERRAIIVEASSGQVSLAGNVLTKQARESARLAVAAALDAAPIANEIIDDVQLELDIGLALDRAGLQRTASIYGRASLGEVTLFGQAPSPAVIDEIVRAVSRVPGVRAVRSRLELLPAGESPTSGPDAVAPQGPG